jgi:acetyl esterase
MSVNPAEKRFFEQFAAEQAGKSPVDLSSLSIDDFRKNAALFNEFVGKAADVKYVDRVVPARDGYPIPIRIYNNDLKEKSPILIFYPGCGYVLPLFEANAIAASRIADHAKIKVIVVDYRLAPEFPFPTSMYDGYDATLYIATHAEEFGIDSAKIFVSGVSSGAHCAATVSYLAWNNQQFKIHHQILLNGMFDLNQTHHEFDDYEKEDLICNRDAATYIFKQYGIESKDYSNPLFSPYSVAEFSGFPSTTILVGEYDGMRNDSEAYYLKLKNADISVNKMVLPGQTHNTMIMRKVMSDGVDPAETIAEVIKQRL